MADQKVASGPRIVPYKSLSIRTRLTAWYALSMLLILSSAGAIAYCAFRANFIHDTDRSLTIKGMEVIYTTAGRELLLSSHHFVCPPIDQGTLIANMQVEFQKDASNPLGDPIYMRLFRTPPGGLVLMSHNVKRHDMIQRTLGPSLHLSPNQTIGGAFVGQNEYDRLRVLNIRVPREPFVLQLATPWKRYEDELNPMITTISAVVVFGFALSAIGGWILVGRTLRPITEIVAEAAKMNGNHLEPSFVAARSVADDEIGRMVSELNAMMGRVHQAIISQRRFTADASHDLKTPLAILRGEIELALVRDRSSEEYRRVLSSSLEETNRLIRIVNDLRELATSEFEKEHRLNRHNVDFALLASNVVSHLQQQARASEIELSFCNAACSSQVIVHADASAIERAIVNLVDNGIHYNTRHGGVTVSLDVIESRAVLKVSDTGIGIAGDDFDHIFDRFYRGDKSRSVNTLAGSSNSGLGLAIVKSVISAHNGTITVESELGLGTTFTISLPAVQAPVRSPVI